jgi:WhiB family transcriptional regulator, redox-sensing transcriptional regulator
MDGSIWYVTDVTLMEVAKSVCADCPVWRPCLAVALIRREKWGIWGGLSAGERRRLLAQIRKDARDSAVAHEVPKAGEAEEAALVEEALARAEEAGVGTAPRRLRAAR